MPNVSILRWLASIDSALRELKSTPRSCPNGIGKGAIVSIVSTPSGASLLLIPVMLGLFITG